MLFGDRPLFTWLHLSDLHFGHGNDAYQCDQQNLFDCLAEDVETAKKNWPELPPIQALFITGDVAFSGGVRDANEYAKAKIFIGRLTRLLGIGESDVYLVPGNHDVQRDVAKDLVNDARADSSRLESIISTPDECDSLLARFANYTAFANSFSPRDAVAWVEERRVDVLGKLRIVGLNTALLCIDDKDKGKLHLGGQQRGKLVASDEVSIVLTHHPVDDGWLRDADQLGALFRDRASLHLCGHVHDPGVDLTATAGGNHHVRVVAAAAHRDPKEAKSGKLSHGYNIASLMLDPSGRLMIRSWPRRWFPKWTRFRVDPLGVPDRAFFDDKSLNREFEEESSGLKAEAAEPAGLRGVHWWGDPEVRWGRLLLGRKRLDVFGVAVRTLFDEKNLPHVTSFLQSGGLVNVVLADPRYKTSMARYDEDFDKPLGDRVGKVKEVLKALDSLRTQLGADAKNLTVKLARYSFKYSAYRLDDEYLFVPYRMIPGKRPNDTAAFLLNGSGGVVARFLKPDLDELLAQSKPLTDQLVQDILNDRAPQ